MSEISWMLLPALACLVMAVALGWFGLHVLQRGVIFVDLALAQVAALGSTYAVYLGHEPDEPVAYGLALFATAVGAVAFSFARHFERKVPQEALIGIAYAVTAAGAVLILEFASDPHGAEKLQHLAVGNLVWVTPTELAVMAGVVGAVGLLHAVFRRQFMAVTLAEEGVNTGLWDMVFYLSFGLVITSVVHVGGVLLIFSMLVIPAVVARLLVQGMWQRLALGYTVVIPVSLLGVSISYEHAAGPVIVVLLAALLLLTLAVVALRESSSRAMLSLRMLLSATAIGGGLWAFGVWPEEHSPQEHQHDHHDLEHAARSASPAERDVLYREHAQDIDLLRTALQSEGDISLRFLLGTALAKAGEAQGLEVLAEVVRAEAPFLRMEADDRLRILAESSAPDWDPLEGPDSAGLWAGWAKNPPEGWQQRATALTLPD